MLVYTLWGKSLNEKKSTIFTWNDFSLGVLCSCTYALIELLIPHHKYVVGSTSNIIVHCTFYKKKTCSNCEKFSYICIYICYSIEKLCRLGEIVQQQVVNEFVAS
jgi:hypothetical protein